MPDVIVRLFYIRCGLRRISKKTGTVSEGKVMRRYLSQQG
ncbi:hypothetical protein CSB69_3250 [Morganella morganii]|nr:hypothetical protein CSB69_3250 [Morganella morganii]EMP53319.1 hypothetical protein C790_01510 [Morganella morganii SC01]